MSFCIVPVNSSQEQVSIEIENPLIALAKSLRDMKLSPLPISPSFPASQYPQMDGNGSIKRDRLGDPLPKFSGKNPSYLSPSGVPVAIRHKDYQDRLPTDQEIALWWANPETGIGYLHTSFSPLLRTLDLDQKHFADQRACDDALAEILAIVPGAWVDRTPSGGYHIALCLEDPGFTNFGLGGIAHAGELLGVGRFVAMAPTAGYTRLQDGYFFPTTIEGLGITPPPSKAKKSSPQLPQYNHQGFGYGTIPLELLGVAHTLEILNGANPAGDRSASLATAIQEWMGWANWCESNGVGYRGTPHELAHVAGQALGIDADRCDRILATIDPSTCTPAAAHRGGDDACWKRVAKLDGRYRDRAYPPQPPQPAQREESPPVVDRQRAKADRLKLELKALQKETDPILRTIREQEICSHYQISKKDLEKCLQALKVQTDAKAVQYFTMAEFFAQTSEALEWIIPGLLPKGECALLVGDPGCGKSILSTDLAFAVATGEAAFMGETPQQGKVLYISVDESPTSTLRKFQNRGIRSTDESVKILTSFDLSQMIVLEAILEDFRPDLVVVDSLKRITQGSGISENDAAFADSLYTLKELFQRYGAASLIIHHTKKGEGVGVESVRGSSAIAGAVWAIWQLDQIPREIEVEGAKKWVILPNDVERIFHTPKVRDVEGVSLKVELDLEHMTYTALGEVGIDASVLAESKELESRILGYLSDGIPRAKVEIFNAVGGSKPTVYRVISKLVSRKQLSQRPSNTDKRTIVVQYRCGSSEPSTPPPYP